METLFFHAQWDQRLNLKCFVHFWFSYCSSWSWSPGGCKWPVTVTKWQIAQRKIYSQPNEEGSEQQRMLCRWDLNLTHFNLIGFSTYCLEWVQPLTSKFRKIGIWGNGRHLSRWIISQGQAFGSNQSTDVESASLSRAGQAWSSHGPRSILCRLYLLLGHCCWKGASRAVKRWRFS